jgi:hypothetical protein
LAGITDEFLSVLLYLGAIMHLGKVLLLRIKNPAACGDCSQLVLANAPRKNFVLARRRVEVPFATTLISRQRCIWS